MFGVALALTNSRGGILVIDEAENGLHYAVETAYWRMVLRAAHEGNVQVLATTHSWDCVKGFARGLESEDIDGALVRLERDEEGIRAVEYSEEELETAADLFRSRPGERPRATSHFAALLALASG